MGTQSDLLIHWFLALAIVMCVAAAATFALACYFAARTHAAEAYLNSVSDRLNASVAASLFETDFEDDSNPSATLPDAPAPPSIPLQLQQYGQYVQGVPYCPICVLLRCNVLDVPVAYVPLSGPQQYCPRHQHLMTRIGEARERLMY